MIKKYFQGHVFFNQQKTVQNVGSPYILNGFSSSVYSFLKSHYFIFLKTATPLWPPKPREPEAAQFISPLTPLFGT